VLSPFGFARDQPDPDRGRVDVGLGQARRP
jgi:hypothetical protein